MCICMCASQEAEQITPERSSRKSHPYRRHCDERDHTSMNATRRQLFAPSQPSATHLPRQPSSGVHGLDYAAPAHGLDAVDCHPQSQPLPQACARARWILRISLSLTPQCTDVPLTSLCCLPRRRPAPASLRPSAISDLSSRTSTLISSPCNSPLSLILRKPP